MKLTPLKIVAVSFLALILIGGIVAYQAASTLLEDQYADDPKVVKLPTGFDPAATTSPYSGPHPSRKPRRPDSYDYPIPIGEAGPATPTYADELDYPFACRTEAAGLGQPLPDNDEDAGTAIFALDGSGEKTQQIVGFSKDCSVNTTVHYFYLSSESGEFHPLADESGDIAEIEVDGERVPFVVRVESGTLNRYIYMIGLLRGPNDTPEQPDLTYWNRKLIYLLRGGIGIGRRQGRFSLDYIPDRRREFLAQGFAVAHSTGNQTSAHYDIELAEDTLARMKRHFVARYGDPEYTIGLGGSGGALQQYLIDQNRPGLLDGGITMQSYPDMVTQTTKVMDCELLEHFFDVTDVANDKWKVWTQRSWILGFNADNDMVNDSERLRFLQSLSLLRWPTVSGGQTECTRSWRNLTPQIANPTYTYFASLFAEDIRAKVRWTYWDSLKHVYGTDDDGFALRTYDNVGVQYGLRALTRGQIDMQEFLRLNKSIGGWKPPEDMLPERYWLYAAARSSLADLSVWSHHNMVPMNGDGTPTPRNEGDLGAIAAAYRSGQVYVGAATMPIIDFRAYLEPELDMHHAFQSFSARLRMMRRQGHARNQLIWFTRHPATPLGDAVEMLDRWIGRRNSNPTLSVVDARPTDAADRCYADSGEIIANGDGVWDGAWNDKEDGVCMKTYPIFSNPRIEAGDTYFGDVFKCHLQSVDAAIAKGLYAPIDVSAHSEDLMRVFPDGVCDYSRGDAAMPDDLFAVH